MSYQPFDEKTLGLSYDDQSLKAAYVVFEKGNIRIKKLFDISLTTHDRESDVNQLYINPDENELKTLAHRSLVISAVATSDLLVRRLRMKLTKDSDIDEAFAFQAEPLLPYPIDTAVIDKLILEKQEGITLLAVLAAKKEVLQKQLDFLKNHDLDPEVITAEPIACAVFASQFLDPQPAQFLLHIGRTTSFAMLLRNNKLLSSHTISKGWQSLYQAFQEDHKDNPLALSDFFSNNPELQDVPRFRKAQEELLHAVQWNYLAQLKETKLKETPVLSVLGEGANIRHLTQLIAKELSLNLSDLKNLPSNVSLEELRTFALPIGTALSGQPKFQTLINFRKQELVYTTPWKRYKKPLFAYATLSVLLALALFLFGLSYLNYIQDGLKNRYLSLLSLVQKPYEQFESQVEARYPTGSETLLPVTALTPNDLHNRLDTLEKEIRSMPDTFPLLPNTPTVSDTLAWLSTHPTLVCQEGQIECPTFSIDTFHYSVVKRPELNKRAEKYQVKVDLEFNTSSSRLAREFHDALIAPNDFVDPKGEIKWNATKGKYQTSFFLKDKTVYPSPIKDVK